MAWHEQPNAAVAFCIALEAMRSDEGTAVTILCDDPEAEDIDRQTAVEVSAYWTDWKPRRFYGRTILDAIVAAGIEQAKAR